jgi:hypothetical protein
MRLPENLQNHIYSFFNPNKQLYEKVLVELRQKLYFQALIKQLNSFSTFDRNRNLITFQKDAILQTL